MKDATVKVTAEEQLQMEAILLDRDKDAAMEFVRLLRDRIAASANTAVRPYVGE